MAKIRKNVQGGLRSTSQNGPVLSRRVVSRSVPRPYTAQVLNPQELECQAYRIKVVTGTCSHHGRRKFRVLLERVGANF